MATVHPSRLGLVPQAAPSRPAPPPPVSREDELRQRLLDRKRQDGRGNSRGSDRDDRLRDDSRYRSRGDDDARRSGRDHRDERRGEGGRRAEDGEESGHGDRRRRPSRSPQRHERDPAARDDRFGRDNRPGDRSRPDDRDDRSRRDEQDQRSRRASPSYNAYTAPQPGNGAGPGYGPGAGGLGQSAPWQDIRNGMPPFPPRGPPRGGGGGGGWNGPIDLERRRQERDNMTLTVWPPSPKEPFRNDEELAADRKAAKKKSKKSKSKSKRRSKYSSDSDSTDSEEERRRRKRKERRRERKSKKYSDSESESDDERERRKRRRKSSEKRSRRTEERDEEDQWVEKGGEVALKPKSIEPRVVPVAAPPPLDDSDEEVGPQLPVDHSARDRTHRSAYANMGRGEGEAMAAFVASGERIPRRGEIGMEAEVIDKFEKSGYVMSGSRHQRMNAVRMRKENQVINAEEKRAILKLQREEKDKKEGAIVAQFREMLQDNLAKQAGKG